MSGRFDESLEASWGRFEQRLLAQLGWLADDEAIVLTPEKTVGAPCVLFVAREGRLVAEVSGNSSLAEPWRLSRVDHRKLRALGWSAPRSNRPHWWTEASVDEVPLVVSMALGALRQVFGVVSPDFLTGLPELLVAPEPVGESASHHETDQEDEHGVFQVGWPSSREDLGRMIGRFLVEHRGVAPEDAGPDEDGDWFLTDGTAGVWLRPMRDLPGVTVFSTLVHDIEDFPAALVEANVLNRRVPWCRFSCEGSRLVLYSDVVATPFAAHQLHDRLDHVFATLAELGPDVHERLTAPLRMRSDRKDIA